MRADRKSTRAAIRAAREARRASRGSAVLDDDAIATAADMPPDDTYDQLAAAEATPTRSLSKLQGALDEIATAADGQAGDALDELAAATDTEVTPTRSLANLEGAHDELATDANDGAEARVAQPGAPDEITATTAAADDGPPIGIRKLLPLLALLPPVPDTQYLDYLELFAGTAAVSKMLTLVGYIGEAHDLALDESYDFLTPIGFMRALQGVMRLRIGAIFWAAPVCSSWIWLSRHSTGRHKHVLGSGSSYVSAQNQMASRLAYLVVLATTQGAWWIVEQPVSSIFWDHPHWRKVLQRYRHILHEVVVHGGCYNLESQKPLKLVGTAPYLQQLARTMTPAERALMRGNSDRRIMVCRDTKGGVQGSSSLKSSQSYPIGFGAAHALAYQEMDSQRTGGRAVPREIKADDCEGNSCEDECFADLKHWDATVWNTASQQEWRDIKRRRLTHAVATTDARDD